MLDLEPGQPPESRLSRLRDVAATLGCTPAEALALAVLLTAAAGTLGLLSLLAGRPAAPAPTVAVEVVDIELTVHVSGEVRTPGVYRLHDGARVADALEAAGGPLPDADLDRLNLARPLADGEQLVVGGPEAPEVAGHEHAPPSAWRADGRLDLNLATAADLEQLPGVGPVTAQRILDHRDRLGRFSAVSDLRGVAGIGEKRLLALVDLVDV
jgi:competence protein ComEA